MLLWCYSLGVKADLIIIDHIEEVTMTAEETWAWDQSEKISAYGNSLGEPVHPFVQHNVYMAILGARRRGRREARKTL